MAIAERTVVAAAPRADRRVVARSRTLGSDFELDLDRPGPPRRGVWGDYVEGTARALLARGVPVGGASLLIDSEVPGGAGLSASAALEIAVGLALAALAGRADLDRVALAQTGQAAEHEYVGTLCGIMDQYIVALGTPGHALLIDCRSLEARPVAMTLGEAVFVVCDTRVKHELASSAYNERRAECEAAVRALAGALPGVQSLRDVTPAALEGHAELLSPTVQKRARHVVGENARTLEAAEALQAGDLVRVGRLMTASHSSLRDDYEVSSPELDLAVESALASPGVHGARMTGGGFGGSAIALVERERAGAVIERMTRALADRFGLAASAFATSAHAGARED